MYLCTAVNEVFALSRKGTCWAEGMRRTLCIRCLMPAAKAAVHLCPWLHPHRLLPLLPVPRAVTALTLRPVRRLVGHRPSDDLVKARVLFPRKMHDRRVRWIPSAILHVLRPFEICPPTGPCSPSALLCPCHSPRVAASAPVCHQSCAQAGCASGRPGCSAGLRPHKFTLVALTLSQFSHSDGIFPPF